MVNPTPAVKACAYATYGQAFTFTTTHTNSGATTLNPSSTGVVAFRLIQNLAMTGGEIVGGSEQYGAFCDGNEWILVGSGAAGQRANPAGSLNLAGAYIIPEPQTSVIAAGTTAGFTFATPPLGSSGGSRQMLNFLCIPLASSGCAGSENSLGSIGYDNDNIINISGMMWAFQNQVENFNSWVFQSEGTGDNVTIFQNNTPAAGALAVRVNAPSSSTRIFGVDPNNGSAVLPRFTVSSGTGFPALPAASLFAGATVIVTDATSFTPGACVGGGSDTMLAVSDGSTWTCH